MSEKRKPTPEELANLKRYGKGCLYLLVLIAAVFIVIVVGLFIFSPRTLRHISDKSANPTEIVKNDKWDASVRQVERYLRGNLKDPDSYESIEWSPVEKSDSPYYKYMVRHKYRAKNSFGGYLISNDIFYLDINGEVVYSKPYIE